MGVPLYQETPIESYNPHIGREHQNQTGFDVDGKWMNMGYHWRWKTGIWLSYLKSTADQNWVCRLKWGSPQSLFFFRIPDHDD